MLSSISQSEQLRRSSLVGFLLVLLLFVALSLALFIVGETVAESVTDFPCGIARGMTDFTGHVARGVTDGSAGFLNGIKERVSSRNRGNGKHQSDGGSNSGKFVHV